MILPEPHEYVDVAHGGTFSMRVTGYLDGTAVIHPRNPSARQIAIYMSQNQLTAPPAPGTPIGIETVVLRLYGQRLDEYSPASYWDISSKTLRADLLARLGAGLTVPFLLTLSANGHAPHKRYSVTIGNA